MNPISMKHLRYFDALARLGHFGRAAEDCAVTQPALSMQVKELEELIGAPLVERTSRQTRLTGLGEAFAARVQAILQAVDELEDLARSSQAPFTGRLRIGAIPTVAPYLLPGLVADLTRDYPGLDLRLREAVTQKLVADLLEARLDAALVALPVSEPLLVEAPLFDEDFILLRPAEEAHLPVPAADDFSELRLLLLEEGHCFREQALAFCKMSGVRTPRNIMEGNALATLVQMVGAGIGMTLVPEIALGLETRSARVAMARLADPPPSRTIGLVWRRSSPLAEDLRSIGDVARRVALTAQAEALKLAPRGKLVGRG